MYRRGKTWWFRYTPFSGARQVRVSLDTDDETAAVVAATQIENREPLGGSGEFMAEVEAYFADCARNHKLSGSTITGRRYVLAEFAKTCEVSRPSGITQAAAERWVTSLRKKLSPLAVRTYLMHLRAFCSWLVRRNKLRDNPVRKVELGKLVVRARKNFVVKDQIRKLIEATPDDDLRFVLFCGFHAGMRKLEIVEARPEWFRLSEGTHRGCVRVEQTETFRPKDKEERTIPLTAEFETFLRDYLPKLPKNAVWVLQPRHRNKSPVYRIFLDRAFYAFMRAQKVRCTLHDMRRSFVSNKLIDDSSLIFKLAKWTGTDVVTLQKHYGHLLADDEDIEAGV